MQFGEEAADRFYNILSVWPVLPPQIAPKTILEIQVNSIYLLYSASI
jgi:hypothetical protein